MAHQTGKAIGRRAALLVIGAAAGCTGGLSGVTGGDGQKMLSFSAAPIHVADDAVSAAGFTRRADKPVQFERTIDVQGQSQQVTLQAHMLQFERSYQGAPLGSVVILSVPQVKMFGQQINIANRASPTSLVDRAQSQSSAIQTQQKIGEQSVNILGKQRTVEVYRGTASQGGQSTPVRVYRLQFLYQGDTIIMVGVVPQSVGKQTQDIHRLLTALQYGTRSES